MRIRPPRPLGAALAMALISVVGWPALATVREAWREAGEGGARVAGAGGVARPVGLAIQTAKLVILTEAIALPAGVALAVLLFRTDAWGRRATLGLLATAVFVPLPLVAAAWIGAVGSLVRAQEVGLPVAAFLHGMQALPWVVLLSGVGLRSVEPELEEAALLDLPGVRVVWRVTLRRAVGPIAGAALAAAVLTAGDMTVTDLVQVRTYAEEAYTSYAEGRGPGTAAAVALPPMLALGVVVFLGARALLRADPARWPSSRRHPRTWRLGAWRVPAGLLVAGLVGGMTLGPVASLVDWAGRVGRPAAAEGRGTGDVTPRMRVGGGGPKWSLAGLEGSIARAGAELLGPPEFFLARSAAWAGIGAALAVALAWPMAWECRRPGPWRVATAGVAALTLAVPGPVAGMALVLAYRDIPAIYDTPAIYALAYAMRALPYALLVLWPAIRGLPDAYLEAAALDGLGAWGRARRVAWPMSRGATLAAWGVAFVLALGELPTSNLVEPPGSPTAAKFLWGLLHTGVESHLAGVGLVLLAPFALAGGLASLSLGRAYEIDEGWRSGSGSGSRGDSRPTEARNV